MDDPSKQKKKHSPDGEKAGGAIAETMKGAGDAGRYESKLLL